MVHDRCQSWYSASACSGSKRRESGYKSHKRGLNTKLHMAVDAHGMPVRVVLTEGTTADCTQASRLITGRTASYLLADKAYDTRDIIEQAINQGMESVIPPKKNHKVARAYDKDISSAPLR